MTNLVWFLFKIKKKNTAYVTLNCNIIKLNSIHLSR